MKNYTLYGSTTANVTTIYIHGGGYVMGERNDLPLDLIESLTHDNRQLITIDYPLAPQMKVPSIVSYVEGQINELIKEYDITKLILFGRSSGANLMLTIDPNALSIPISGLISFYGYNSNDLSWMSSAIMNSDYPIQDGIIKVIEEQTETSFSRPLLSTYPYYYSLRKLSLWSKDIGIEKQEILWPKDLKIFVAHSIFDPDVPFKCSLEITNHFNDALLYKSISKQHAFDQNGTESSILLAQLLLFLNNF